jgi:NADP-dependent 3-hydroxy acid dehydrogenase YdfG
LPGPLVVITGTSSGIGLALARGFAKEDNALLLIARHMKAVDGLPADRTEYAEADVADYAALERAIRSAEQKFGKTACLVPAWPMRAPSPTSSPRPSPARSMST